MGQYPIQFYQQWLPYSGKLSGEKTFTNRCKLDFVEKTFVDQYSRPITGATPRKFVGKLLLMVENPLNSQTFSPLKSFPLYGIYHCMRCLTRCWKRVGYLEHSECSGNGQSGAASQAVCFLMENIPSTQPIFIIEDGHTSHISIDVIKLACKNDIHLLC